MTHGRARLATHPRDDLTPRQREVMDLIAQGKTNFEIAQTLGITLEGAKYHVSEMGSPSVKATPCDSSTRAKFRPSRGWSS